MADRIVAMNGGIIQQVGTPLELYDNPANIFVAGFIGSPAMNFLDARLVLAADGAQLRLGEVILGNVPMPAGLSPGGPVTVGIRPELVALSVNASGVPARIVLIEPTGLGTVAHLEIGGQLLKLFTTDRPKIAIGDHARLHVAPSDLRLFDPQTGIRLR